MIPPPNWGLLSEFSPDRDFLEFRLRGLQQAGGGRTKWVVTGRKIAGDSGVRLVSVAVTLTGAVTASWVWSFAFGAEQREQE
jgi:hypothetical protein